MVSERLRVLADLLHFLEQEYEREATGRQETEQEAEVELRVQRRVTVLHYREVSERFWRERLERN